VAGRSTCTVCSGNGGTAQLAESLCGDNSDNDCDGLVDCQDPDCGGLRCSATGMLCTAATKRCECAGGSFEAVADCADLEDNDCDGKVDCADSDCVIGTPCRIASQPSFGTKCAAGGVCLCSGNGGTPEASETTCSDGKDNDCDGKVDCADSNCQPSAPGASDGKYCSAAALGRKCDATGACVCPLGQTTESTCDDNLDNDCDGLADCQDPDCLNLVCSSTGKKCNSSKACVCPSGLTSEDNCMNSVDDDCDGLVDCADPNCANKQCNAVSTNFQCIGSPAICKDTTASYSLVLTALPTRIPADGLATSLVTATLRDTNGNAQAGKTVAFAVTTGPGGIAAAPPVPITDAGGKTNATYVSGTGAGPATVTASYNTGTSTVTGSIDIDTPRLGQVKFVGQQYQTMGVKYSSYQENNQLTFQVLDAANSPYPPGLSVTFKHGPVGGSTLVGETTATCTTTECTTTAKTLTGGYVSVNLVSGTVASVVSVTASATAGGGTGNATAGNIAIVGAKASGSHLSISCSPRNIPGFASHDCTNSLVNASITCSAAFADRFNNVLGVPTLATLSTEAGAAGPPTTTNLQGIASNFVAVQGFRLPVDVDPDSAQGEWYKAYDSGCGGVKTHNPRDGLSSVIVSASGEEGFVDGSNGCAANGVYDGPGSVCPGGDGKGEYFIDIGEPFIDANDNGKRDANEYYVDVNNNGAWDPPNGKWDGTTVIWAETRVLYSGLAAVYAEAGWEELSRWYPSSDWPPTSGASLTPYITLAPPTTSRMVPYYFADQNFNILVPQTAFNVYMITSSSTSVRSVTSQYVPDGLGVSLTQQFCSTSTGGSCSNACNAAPCYVVTTVSNFAYGNYGDVEVTRGNKTESWIVRASASLGGVSTFLDLPGGSACVAAGNNCNSGPDCCSGNCVTQPINDAGVPPKLCQ
ncbi:MAG TPA: Ig-like domain-containing protein, partial [Myxococcales bacterium]